MTKKAPQFFGLIYQAKIPDNLWTKLRNLGHSEGTLKYVEKKGDNILAARRSVKRRSSLRKHKLFVPDWGFLSENQHFPYYIAHSEVYHKACW